MILLNKIFKKIKNKAGFEYAVLIVLFAATVVYSFLLADKRYNNYEFGKFDLGNMAQIVWNTANGRFMEVTDQFGTNMPRWGMSHVDPILAVFAPLFWFYPSPMVLVFAQHLLIVSAIFPLYFLVKIKTKNCLAGFLVALTYILYPANGFSLVWTGFHGISFTAPLLIWMVWFLEKTGFLNFSRDDTAANWKITWYKAVYWILVILMLMGKEEIGAILAIGCVFLYFKNKRLAVQTAIVSLIWFFAAFFVIIPSYANLRQQSITTFVERLGAVEADVQSAGRDNFFISRYLYLGSNYGEIAKNIILKPNLVLEVIFQSDKLTAVNNLLGPFGYVVIFSPLWVVSLPDLAIVLLSKDEIFDISNHRIAFVVSSLFLSYVYLLALLSSRFFKSKFSVFERLNMRLAVTGFAFLVLFLNVWFSQKTENPLYISAKSFVESKIVNKIFAESNENPTIVNYKFGEMRRAKIPRNTRECLDEMNQIVKDQNPSIYTGPDYLGAQSSLRRVNALYPSRYWDADLVIADLFDSKTFGPLGPLSWPLNKEGLRRMLESGDYAHVYSCDKVSAFAERKPKDFSEFIEGSLKYEEGNLLSCFYELFTNSISLCLRKVDLPFEINKEGSAPLIVEITKGQGEFKDKMTFWTFEKADNSNIKRSFVNYVSVGFRESIDTASEYQTIKESYYPVLPEDLPAGEYNIFYGVGDLLDAKEMYVGKVIILQK